MGKVEGWTSIGLTAREGDVFNDVDDRPGALRRAFVDLGDDPLQRISLGISHETPVGNLQEEGLGPSA